MDWVFLSTITIFFVVGAYRGFVSSLFSFVGSWVILLVAYFLCGRFANLLQNTSLFEKTIPTFIEKSINSVISGEFSNVEELKTAAVASEGGRIFIVLIMLFTKNLQIDGQMTAGKILSPSITVALSKIFTFLIIFVALSIFLAFAKRILEKFIKLPSVRVQNRVLGGVLGIVQGLFVFLIFYGVFTGVGGLIFSKKLISISKNGVLSSKLYKFVSKKIVSLFY